MYCALNLYPIRVKYPFLRKLGELGRLGRRVHPLRCTNSFEKGLLKTRGTRGIVLRKKNIFALIGMLPVRLGEKNHWH
jgi:hypothetical protein